MSLLATTRRSVERLVEFDDCLAAVLELVDSAEIQTAEATDALRRYGESIDAEPQRQQEVEERLNSMHTIARKHRIEPAELPALPFDYAMNSKNSAGPRNAAGNSRAKSTKPKRSIANRQPCCRGCATKAAGKMSAAVSDTMSGLGMPVGFSKSMSGNSLPMRPRPRAWMQSSS